MPCQSSTHSATPVCMFCTPHSFGSVNSVRIPARAAYSHSASVGRRYGLPSFLVSHSQNATASFQLTPDAYGA